MNVNRTDPALRLATGSASPEAGEVGRAQATPAVEDADRAPREDRFELSDAARAQQAEAAERQAEVDAARAALQSLGDLPAARVAELRARVEQGYYDQPDAVEAVSARIAEALQRGEADGADA